VSFAAASVLAALLLWQPDDFLAFATALFAAATVLLAPPITVGLMVDVRHQKRAGGQLRLGQRPARAGDHVRRGPVLHMRRCLNLAPLCRRHHRAKQARGLGAQTGQPGVLAWTTPSGRHYVV